MEKFTITFNGRLKGALGLPSVFVVEVEAPDIFAALVELYKTHENIRIVTHSEVT